MFVSQTSLQAFYYPTGSSPNGTMQQERPTQPPPRSAGPDSLPPGAELQRMSSQAKREQELARQRQIQGHLAEEIASADEMQRTISATYRKIAAQRARERDANNAPLRILCLDGGGIKGLVPAIILQEIEQKCGHRIDEMFDLVVGTSTGGIIALGTW